MTTKVDLDRALVLLKVSSIVAQWPALNSISGVCHAELAEMNKVAADEIKAAVDAKAKADADAKTKADADAKAKADDEAKANTPPPKVEPPKAPPPKVPPTQTSGGS